MSVRTKFPGRLPVGFSRVAWALKLQGAFRNRPPCLSRRHKGLEIAQSLGWHCSSRIVQHRMTALQILRTCLYKSNLGSSGCWPLFCHCYSPQSSTCKVRWPTNRRVIGSDPPKDALQPHSLSKGPKSPLKHTSSSRWIFCSTAAFSNIVIQ